MSVRHESSHEQHAETSIGSGNPQSDDILHDEGPSKVMEIGPAGIQATMSSRLPDSDNRDDYAALSDSCSTASFKTAQPISPPPSFISDPSTAFSSVFHTPTILPQDSASQSSEQAELSSLESNNPPLGEIESSSTSEPGSAGEKDPSSV